jgi:RsiW-degrading membrane proteinase PrsW (M82 family)
MARMELYGQCTVCGKELAEPKVYGSRSYCETHLAAFWEDVPPTWRASTMTVGLILLAIVGLVIVNQFFAENMHRLIRLAISIGIALFPAFAWLVLLYRTAARRRIARPSLLPTIFILAALLAAAVTRPLLFELVDLDAWLWRTTASNRFLGNILIAGFFHTFVLYAIVRYTVWRTPAFTHRVHGVLYELAAALGYATMLNLLFVLEQGGLASLNGGLRLITRLCAYLAPSLIIGYYLGRNRFEDMPFYYLTMGQVMAAVLNGLLLYAGSELNNIGLSIDQDGFSPWPGLVLNLAALIAAVVAIYGLLQRHNKLTRARLEQAS